LALRGALSSEARLALANERLAKIAPLIEDLDDRTRGTIAALMAVAWIDSYVAPTKDMQSALDRGNLHALLTLIEGFLRERRNPATMPPPT